ncbi:MAG: glycine--tRNA ligase [Candidatus Andersenbacteria bacterium RIFCSPHIGHO2_02_FULL_45_11]|uniref:Glycine--tRNA ligase n=1 Tax=Candidatus Andersenbacteria bacterium RIFCSPHIGHO2_12_FULL_45_11 TaxID=1797281 RepID=A0A1G1X0V8_9BACT|nr:MAG: glycine--tRNA ligase [Candidatus Andersenbacteria bacterium RIFCSPHIGHO2_01_FULL_46_36]OGY31940.1 MAG: glycine--tRNA ligase [Candidatus Andersenbacteria bacterium RIFCSPHIGHO2_02_FULL_45_11]OGY33646.1 MAG: glycine--tRNA ligase [Candidatus Andersenbacteria bacterium RIFCSPHIGHO2_12_FULL_45_11]
MADVSMDTIVNLAKRRGFIFPGSEIYGGLANSWDYGPLGVELKNNIKQAWWKKFVTSRLDMVGIDSALIMNPKVWEASGHIATFSDPLVECKNCHERYRADQIDTSAPCQKCGEKNTFTDPAAFNLMLKTYLGPKEDATAKVYLRPETAQAMFVDFAQVLATSRKRVPFGIAQAGKMFRNEITPGNFIFRQREFDVMELEYFVHPSQWEQHFTTWLATMHEWISECGIQTEKTHDLEVSEEDRAHYSSRTVDIEFDYPFGRKELYGLAYRSDFDLKNHSEHSGKELTYTDPSTNEKYTPHVIEPTFGLDRTVLAVLVSAYDEEVGKDGETRVVLRLKPHLAPIKAAILPLMKKEELVAVARPLAEQLAAQFPVEYDETQSIGKRYRRQDEIGTPYCITVDYDSLEDKAVTVRDRDTMVQERISIEKLPEYLRGKIG